MYGNEPLFGINIDPRADGIALAHDLAAYADAAGIAMIGIQDHPYNPEHLETWTLLSYLAAQTKSVSWLVNVANLPLRPPAMLAKSAATLDVLSGGRLELGLGSGAIWESVASYGGPRRSPAEAVSALEEAIQIMRLLWDANGSETASFAGQFYTLNEAKPGPLPTHPIRIWLGALKPRMVRLTGSHADGWSISHNWMPPEQVQQMRPILDQAAVEAGRSPADIRRNYNLMGLISTPATANLRARPGMIVGDVAHWAERIADFYVDLGMDTFNFWPIAGDTREQVRLWAEEVMPAARKQIADNR